MTEFKLTDLDPDFEDGVLVRCVSEWVTDDWSVLVGDERACLSMFSVLPLDAGKLGNCSGLLSEALAAELAGAARKVVAGHAESLRRDDDGWVVEWVQPADWGILPVGKSAEVERMDDRDMAVRTAAVTGDRSVVVRSSAGPWRVVYQAGAAS